MAIDCKINFSNGLVPVVVQENETGEVLMLAYMNEEAFIRTLESGRMTYYSRSRKELWRKGDTSGHYQILRSLALDCDSDTLLAKVTQEGPACHTGKHSCFFQEIVAEENHDEDASLFSNEKQPGLDEPIADCSKEAAKTPARILETVMAIIGDRRRNPKEGSYTNYLFDKGLDKILKKIGEESAEIIIAAKNEGKAETVYEIADFLYHMMVLMEEKGITWDDVLEELSGR